MARPIKHGLDYFPLDVNFDLDDKFQLLTGKHNSEAGWIVLVLMCKIYSEGYFYKWTEREQILLSKRVNSDLTTVIDVINSAIHFEIFDAEKYERYGILTSAGIQKRFFEATKMRKNSTVNKEYLVNSELTLINSELTPINLEFSTQSKVKKSKVKKSKEKKSRESTEKFTPPPSDEVGKFFQELGQDKTESEKFYNYYTANGWTTSNGKAVSNWQALVKNWISRIKTADKSPPVVDKSEKNIKKLAEDNFKKKPIDKIIELSTLSSGTVNLCEVIRSVMNGNNGLTNDYNFEKHTEKLIKLYLQNKNIEYA